MDRFEKEGVDGLRDKAGRGRKPRLTPAQMQRLEELLDGESPAEHCYNTQRWTGPLLIDWIAKEFGVRFKKAHIYNLIASLGFSYQKAKGIYPEADPSEQQAFKQVLKKTPGSSR